MVFRECKHFIVRMPFPSRKLVRRARDLAIRRFSAGTLGPVAFGLGLRDSCLVIMFFTMLAAIGPSYL